MKQEYFLFRQSEHGIGRYALLRKLRFILNQKL